MPDIGPRAYWIGEQSFEWLKEESAKEHLSIRAFIELHYEEWCSKKLSIKDNALVEFWKQRIAQGAGDSSDPLLFKAMYGDYGRWPHSLNLSVQCVTTLAQWTIEW